MTISDADALKIANGVLIAVTQAAKSDPIAVALIQNQNMQREELRRAHSNPLTQKGCKYFSQNDEDGILLEIIRRIGAGVVPHFIEFGVGNGLENNTLILLMHGWRGFWAGGEDLAINIRNGTSKLGFEKIWIARENAVRLIGTASQHAGGNEFGVFSLDIDGVDYYVAETMLEAGFRPQIITCEYNGKFPPPVEFKVDYRPDFQWDTGKDYFGASLQSFTNLFSRFDYVLVACNITGTNAFFVRKEFASQFADIPNSISEIFVPANYGLMVSVGHPPSVETINAFI